MPPKKKIIQELVFRTQQDIDDRYAKADVHSNGVYNTWESGKINNDIIPEFRERRVTMYQTSELTKLMKQSAYEPMSYYQSRLNYVQMKLRHRVEVSDEDLWRLEQESKARLHESIMTR